METKSNQQAQKPQKSGCCGCGCGDARELEAAPQQTAAERTQSAQPEPTEESCCGG